MSFGQTKGIVLEELGDGIVSHPESARYVYAKFKATLTTDIATDTKIGTILIVTNNFDNYGQMKIMYSEIDDVIAALEYIQNTLAQQEFTHSTIYTYTLLDGSSISFKSYKKNVYLDGGRKPVDLPTSSIPELITLIKDLQTKIAAEL